jgi:hypothetical protein
MFCYFRKNKIMERLDSLSNNTMDAKEALGSLPEMTKNTTLVLEEAKKVIDQLGQYLFCYFISSL